MTPDQRNAVVAEARSWLRTPYHDHGRIKGVGADCALMPLDVYSAALFPTLGIVPPQPPDYVQQWHLHRSEERYLGYVQQLGAVPVEAPQPGDFVLFRIGRVYSHGGIVVAWPWIIHAVNPSGVELADVSIDERLNRTAISQPLFFTF